ncbi:MAG: helix-turn-helix domain-containing protein [Opitutaceae bacterium]|nr:helix-turn-helix domain-containing protein [Opitutaceae bacterium]
MLHPKLHRRRRSAALIRQWQLRRNAWLRGLQPESLFYRLFDHIPNMHFFAKDAEGCTMFVSRGILERFHMTDESEIVGLTDFHLVPASMAHAYVEDDRRLLGAQVERIERLELWFDEQGTPDWFVVTKLPLFDRRGKTRGVMGVIRRPEQQERRLPVFQTVARAVEQIRKNYASPLLIATVARDCGQSLRQLQRRFQAAFGFTPQDFLLRTRVVAAARLLQDTNFSIAQIASRCGFVDQSAFSQQFRKRTGSTPTDYRRACAMLPQMSPRPKRAGRASGRER